VSYPSLLQEELELIWHSLPKGPMPLGTYDGYAWSPKTRLIRLASMTWRGKIFTNNNVKNRIWLYSGVDGVLAEAPREWIIRYPPHNLIDRLRWIPEDKCYLGHTYMFEVETWFTLTKKS
jgi:hypothetical protein